jgi:uncharacterized protein YuzE
MNLFEIHSSKNVILSGVFLDEGEKNVVEGSFELPPHFQSLMKFKYNSDIDALRIYVQEGKFDDTIQVSDDVFVDYDEDKNVLSIEILYASKMLKEIEYRHSGIDQMTI